MMARWSLALAASLGVLAMSIGAILWIVQVNDASTEALRKTQITHQRLQQQYSLLTSPDHTQQIVRLDQALDALQISLVEAVSTSPVPAGVIDIAFEQQVLPAMSSAGTFYPVTVLRLTLMLTIKHSVGLVNMLDRVLRSASGWPSEVRGCELQRLAEESLSAQCVLDFYHWSDERLVQGDGKSVLGQINGKES